MHGAPWCRATPAARWSARARRPHRWPSGRAGPEGSRDCCSDRPFPAEASGEIVLGLEGRAGEDRLVDWAFAEAGSRGARILALHALGGDFPVCPVVVVPLRD
ncbi:hypothetical protein [Actinomadura sp. RB99]|uniref:hypothetical protein n=1 Tax=Actinomadura sp. RB99 TaxID=2691577 RepID=UPI00168681D1|nr:hypothetical protein [Actinomadura sp. RB99]